MDRYGRKGWSMTSNERPRSLAGGVYVDRNPVQRTIGKGRFQVSEKRMGLHWAAVYSFRQAQD
jgi:hypothetical protein